MRDSPREGLAVTGSGSLSAAQMLIILCEEKRGRREGEIYVQKVRYICKYCMHIIKGDNNKHKIRDYTHLWVSKDKSSPCIILWLCVCVCLLIKCWGGRVTVSVCQKGEQAYSVHMTVQYWFCINLLSQLSLFGSVCVCLLIKCWCGSVIVYVWQAEQSNVGHINRPPLKCGQVPIYDLSATEPLRSWLLITSLFFPLVC